MAIYRNQHSFYINAFTGNYFSNSHGLVAAHEIPVDKFPFVLKVYKIATQICVATLPFSLWFGPVSRVMTESESFLFISVLISVLGVTIFSILFSTLVFRSSSTLVDLTNSRIAIKESKVLYVYFILFCSNMCTLLAFAPWRDGFYISPTIIPPLFLFFIALLFCIYRLLLINSLGAKT